MLLVGQKVLIPPASDGTERWGVITAISEIKSQYDNLTNGRGKVKVNYQAGTGAMTEAWFDMAKVTPVTNIKAVIEKNDEQKEQELKEVSEQKREDTDWTEEPKEDKPVTPSLISRGVQTADSQQAEFEG